MVADPAQHRGRSQHRGRFLDASSSSAEVLVELPAWVRLVRAPNPGPMTLDGTNTWVLRVPDTDEAIVVDPGPLDDGHLAAVAAAAVASTITVVITHGHPDHTEGLDRFIQVCPPARVFDLNAEPSGFHTRSGIDAAIMRTPGHTADSITMLVSVGADRAVFTGDTILGRGTTVVAYPDGDLGDYLGSLRRLEQVGPVPVLPGHGPALADCAAAAAFYLDHRLTRLEQIRAARAAGAETAADVVAIVYSDIDSRLRQAAEWSVRAQLTYLERESIEAPVRLDPP